ncbi:Fc.00g097860.m01.CDS01 [Cosmosporella sp. VM-42]
MPSPNGTGKKNSPREGPILMNGLPTEGWPAKGKIEGTAFLPRKLRILMLGAGISGIQLAHDVTTQLENFDLEIYEKNHGLAHTYQFSWEPNPRWSKYYAPAPEILAYLNNVVDKHDLRKYMRFNHRGVYAEWQEQSATWRVEIEKTDEQGHSHVITRECDIFIQGTGVLNHWKWPEIEGLHDFKGHLLHTASWDNSVDLRGKTVAVIGNAASAVQCVAALQPEVKKLFNYIRTAAWMLPHSFSDGLVQSEYTEDEMKRFETDSQFYYEHRIKLEKVLAGILESMCRGSEGQKTLAQETMRHMESKIKNREILDALKPEFEIGCRRHTPGDHYLNALQQENVTLINSKIVRVTEKGVLDSSGQETTLDALVCATGFDSSYEPRFAVIGKDGYSLSENWGKDKATESYMATMVAKFPNHFVFNAPICPVVGSLYPGIESASSYILRVIHRVQQDAIKTFCVKDDAQREFNEWAQSRMEHMAWSGGCRSWCKLNFPNRLSISPTTSGAMY